MLEKNMIEIEQPIGTFYLSSMKANEILKSTRIYQRKYDSDTQKSNTAVQRIESSERVKNIKMYCTDPDATFPTPIIISINSKKVIVGENWIKFPENEIIGEVIDGQHRLLGIKDSILVDIELPVVFMFDLTREEIAYVFATINGNQVNVPKSLIYDLYGLSNRRSPYKTCHEIARALNSDLNSPFYKRLKMLGKKQSELESLSQGTFVSELVELITNDSQRDEIDILNNNKLKVLDENKYPFRKYFLSDKDQVIYKIILNVFNAVKDNFKIEWESQDYILSKTTGYGAIIKALIILMDAGKRRKSLSYEYFNECFYNFKKYIEINELELKSTSFPSNRQTQNYLTDLIIKAQNI